MKITFTMGDPQTKVHSTRFDLDEVEELIQEEGVPAELKAVAWLKAFKPSFYIPKPLGSGVSRLRVTIEEIE